MALADVLVSAEDKAETVLRAFKPYNVQLARFFFVATFIEDALRMIFQFDDQLWYLGRAMYGGQTLSFLFLIINIVLQLVGPALILTQSKHMKYGVASLFSVVVLQTFGYSMLWSANFFLRAFSLLGCLLLILADSSDDATRKLIFGGGLSDTRENKSKTYMQLGGRLLVVLMHLTLIHDSMSLFRMFIVLIEGILIVLVAIGFKTKLSAFILVITLFTTNFFINNFWSLSTYEQDAVRYDFFQTLSVVGGLLYIVHLGGGDISVDTRKKQY